MPDKNPLTEDQKDMVHSEARTRAILDAAIDAIITIDERGNIESVNPAASRLFGYDAAEMIGQNVKMLMPEPYHSEHDGYLSHYRDTGEKKIIGIGREVSGRRKDGATFPMHLAISELRLGERRMFTGIARDISDVKQAMQAMQNSEAKMRAIVDCTLDGLVTINAKGVISTFNPACERMFGYLAADVIGQNVKMLMPEPYHSQHDGYLAHYMQTGKAKIIGTMGRELTARRKDGSIFPIDLSISAFMLHDGQHFEGIIRDITARKTAEETLRRYTRALEISNRELEEFAHIASHDLKEPLRGIENLSAFLKEDYADRLDEEGMKRLDRIGYLAARSQQLVNDLLHFSELGHSDLAIQETDLNAVIADIREMLAVWLEEKNAKIVVPEPLPVILCDKPRITEAFRNLITNGVKYNDKPEKTVEIRFIREHRMPDGSEQNVFSVRDNGMGIEQKNHEKVFRIFQRLQTASREEGTGVGLAFVKKIVERYGGHIWLDSAPGSGTAFHFTLPCDVITMPE